MDKIICVRGPKSQEIKIKLRVCLSLRHENALCNHRKSMLNILFHRRWDTFQKSTRMKRHRLHVVSWNKTWSIRVLTFPWHPNLKCVLFCWTVNADGISCLKIDWLLTILNIRQFINQFGTTLFTVFDNWSSNNSISNLNLRIPSYPKNVRTMDTCRGCG